MIEKISLICKNCKFDVICFDIILDSFFFKETLDNPNIKEICLYINQVINSEIHDILKYILSSNKILEREIISEDEKSYQSTYNFNSKGFELIKLNIKETMFLDLLLVIDCLDIKPLLVALLNYLSKLYGNTYRDDLIVQARKQRYGLPTLYVK